MDVKNVMKISNRVRTALLFSLGVACLFTTPTKTFAEEWHCLCYQERYQKAVVMATACRTTQQKCAKLADRVESGSQAIIKGSLTHPCTRFVGAHPADVLGDHSAWLKSKQVGSFWTPKGCFIPSKKTSPNSVKDKSKPLLKFTTEYKINTNALNLIDRQTWLSVQVTSGEISLHELEVFVNRMKKFKYFQGIELLGVEYIRLSQTAPLPNTNLKHLTWRCPQLKGGDDRALKWLLSINSLEIPVFPLTEEHIKMFSEPTELTVGLTSILSSLTKEWIKDSSFHLRISINGALGERLNFLWDELEAALKPTHWRLSIDGGPVGIKNLKRLQRLQKLRQIEVSALVSTPQEFNIMKSMNSSDDLFVLPPTLSVELAEAISKVKREDFEPILQGVQELRAEESKILTSANVHYKSLSFPHVKKVTPEAFQIFKRWSGRVSFTQVSIPKVDLKAGEIKYNQDLESDSFLFTSGAYQLKLKSEHQESSCGGLNEGTYISEVWDGVEVKNLMYHQALISPRVINSHLWAALFYEPMDTKPSVILSASGRHLTDFIGVNDPFYSIGESFIIDQEELIYIPRGDIAQAHITRHKPITLALPADLSPQDQSIFKEFNRQKSFIDQLLQLKRASTPQSLQVMSQKLISKELGEQFIEELIRGELKKHKLLSY